ncbi:MAG: PocR ligand-binding domain-containing protein [Desulfotignum sp.]|nr:PocR ligand-binding domain-containing protein [Desulfotignum sp.]MCF8138400.1 PocR ligand-binding domain-containing protein [Desulfotignum sp.]
MAKFNKDQDERNLQKTGHGFVKKETVPSLENGFESIELIDIVDVKAIQSMMDDFHHLTKIGVAILDLKGNVLVATGWQDICTQFHRQHPDTLKNCIESDLTLSTGIAPGSFKAYRCKNHMWDIATPMIVGGKHMGNLYLGQFFYDDEAPDVEWFRTQAARYGFDETAYLAALDRVPRWPRETVHTVMRFYTRFTALMSELSFSNLKLAHEINTHESTIASLKMSEARFAEALAWSQESEEKYRILFEHTSEALFVAQDGRIVFQNPRTFELTGYSLEEFQSRPFASFIHEDDREMVVGRHFQRLKGEKPPERYGFRIFHKNGHILWTELKAVLIQWDQKPAALCFMTDITARKQLEVRLLQAQKLEAIGSLASGIAHDFNNLLFPIVGLSEMMLDDFTPGSPEHDDAQQIFKAGKRGTELVQQILSFSRQTSYRLIPVHIQKILKEVFKFCRATIPADIPITRDIQMDCRPVMADPTHIQQIAMNLITNAFHAVKSVGGAITIALAEMDVDPADDSDGDLVPGRYARLSVSDTGTGIDPAIIDQIFDPYFTTKEKSRGTGLGLATVYGIVKSCGGDIRAHSDFGKGTTIQVFLPLLEKSRETEPEKGTPPLPIGTEHILLVDDDVSIVHLEKQMVKRLGYRTTSFTNSENALAAFRADPTRFDLVITDMNMPHLNGMQLVKELIVVRPDIPIIICTGFSERINSQKAEAMGVKGLLLKPVGMMDLAHKVREVLDLKR